MIFGGVPVLNLHENQVVYMANMLGFPPDAT